MWEEPCILPFEVCVQLNRKLLQFWPKRSGGKKAVISKAFQVSAQFKPNAKPSILRLNNNSSNNKEKSIARGPPFL